jgi:hypothetical protein
VDVDSLVATGPGGELVRSFRRYDEDLAGPADDLFGADGEGGRTAPDDERLGVRVQMQPWADALLGGGLEDDRDARPARQQLVVLGPVLAVIPPIAASDDGCPGVRDLAHNLSPLHRPPP